ncbi:MAG: M48 family metalloprotease [Azospirillaceae bacterium]
MPRSSRRLVAIALALLVAVAGPLAVLREAEAQSRRFSFIRDAEIERVIAGWGAPIARAAGLNPSAIDYYLVNDRALNAFVAGGQNIFLFTGALSRAEDYSEVVGILAHEMGHIAGGHLVRGQDQLEQARRTALLTTLLGVATALASGNAGAGAAVITGGQGYAQRDFLSFTRSMESAADQAAVSFLDRAGLSSAGLLDFLKRLEDQELVPASSQVEYVRTHPLTRDRIDFLERQVARSPYSDANPPADWPEQFRRIQAKLIGFLEPQLALRDYPEGVDTIAGRYGRAIALYRRGDFAAAQAMMEDLLAVEPDNPYFHELEAQMLLETGKAAEARPHYSRAVELAPEEPLLLTALAQTEIEAGGPQDLASAIEHLTTATRLPRGDTSLAWRLLATAYGRTGDLGMAAVALAEEALAKGDEETARAQAQRALDQLPAGSRGALQAQDILATVEP